MSLTKEMNLENWDISKKTRTITKTIIVITNLSLNIERVFSILPVSQHTIAPKKKGRKRKDAPVDNKVQSDCIIRLRLGDKMRGIETKKKKKSVSGKKHFRNAITVVMFSLGKEINFKISSNGKFQMTGCKRDEQASNCIEYIWKSINNYSDCYTFSKGWDKIYPIEEENKIELRAIYNIVMTNIDFNIGFSVNRENLDKYINEHTDYRSFLETIFGYTGVNIKFPMKNVMIEKDIQLRYGYYIKGIWHYTLIPFENYLSLLSPKEISKKKDKTRHNTFLVFHSGNIILSGMTDKYMEDDYYTFINIMLNNRKEIEEVIEA